MHISIKPCDFMWDSCKNSELLSLTVRPSMVLSEIIQYLIELFDVSYQLHVTLSENGPLLDQNKTLYQLEISSKSQLFLYMKAPAIKQKQIAQLSIHIDDIWQSTNLSINQKSTGFDILEILRNKNIFNGDYTHIEITNGRKHTSNMNLKISKLGYSNSFQMHISTNPERSIIEVYQNDTYIIDVDAPQETLLQAIINQLVQNGLIGENQNKVILKNPKGPEQTEKADLPIKAIGPLSQYRIDIYTNLEIPKRQIRYQWQWEEGNIFKNYDEEDINEQIDIGYEEFLKNKQNNEVKLKFRCSKLPGTHIVDLENNKVIDKILKTVKTLTMKSTPNGEQYSFDNKSIPADLNDLIVARKANGSIKFEIFDKRHKIVFSDKLIRQINEETNFTRKVEFVPYNKSQKIAAIIDNQNKYPSEWDHQVTNLLKVDLPSNHVEFKWIQQQFLATNPKGRIHKIYRIQNKLIWQNYMMEKKKLINYYKLKNMELSQIETEKYLWHGVRGQHPKIIYSSEIEAFDVTYSNDNCYWGYGVYFAEKSLYSRDYSYKISQNDDKENAGKLVFLCCLVTTGKVYTCPKDSTLRRPPNGYDCVSGNTDGSQVYVLYQMHVRRAYPAYEVIFE